MTVNSHELLSSTFRNIQALGRKAATGDAVLVIHGHEKIQLLFKQFPWPVATVKDSMEFFGPNGMAMGQPQNNKIKFEGPVGIYEVVGSTVSDELITMISNGAIFEATAYAGRPEDYTRTEELLGAYLVLDVVDRDWENDTPLLLAGTLHFHWFANK